MNLDLELGVTLGRRNVIWSLNGSFVNVFLSFWLNELVSSTFLKSHLSLIFQNIWLMRDTLSDIWKSSWRFEVLTFILCNILWLQGESNICDLDCFSIMLILASNLFFIIAVWICCLSVHVPEENKMDWTKFPLTDNPIRIRYPTKIYLKFLSYWGYRTHLLSPKRKYNNLMRKKCNIGSS